MFWPSLWGGFAACGWPVDGLLRFWTYLGAIATPIAALKAAAISIKIIAATGAMLRMGGMLTLLSLAKTPSGDKSGLDVSSPLVRCEEFLDSRRAARWLPCR